MMTFSPIVTSSPIMVLALISQFAPMVDFPITQLAPMPVEACTDASFDKMALWCMNGGLRCSKNFRQIRAKVSLGFSLKKITLFAVSSGSKSAFSLTTTKEDFVDRILSWMSLLFLTQVIECSFALWGDAGLSKKRLILPAIREMRKFASGFKSPMFTFTILLPQIDQARDQKRGKAARGFFYPRRT